MRCTALLLLALAGSALAGPTGQRSTCALHCSEAENYAYENGKSYVYEYSVTTSTALLETFEDDAHLHITANVHIDVSAPCEYILKLTDVNLDGSSHGPEFAAAVTKSPLRFSFQDGRVESICSEASEPAWVLNFKRGVLSTFQASMAHQGVKDIKETDISGVCMTHYNATVEGSVVTIDKVKDLATCTQRPDLTFIPSTGYISDSPVQSLPIFRSSSKCHQRVEEGLLKTAECEETHVFRPFSSEKGGAVTTAKTTMILMSQERLTPITDFDFKRNTLAFENTLTPEAQLEAVEEILSNLEIASNSEILPEVPSLLAKLVSSLKELNYPQLNTVYNNAKETHTRKFLVDAMPLVGTAASFGVVRDMFINGDMTESEADAFFTSLAFFKNPTAEMFIALAPLLENNPSQKAMLGTSALINAFCKINEDCGADSSVQQVIRRIETQLGSGCRTVNEEEKVRVLVALKALGNAGRWVNANSVLRRCYTEDNDMEVRVAAIEAWRHTPCEYDRSHLLAAFQDEIQDTEVRIAAYLALMTCPTPELINTIKDRLTSEGVNQVGSFIWTHMTNMQESAAPEKQWVRQMIGEELLQKKFSTEALKFSRNYESSFFMNEINTGATVESNVIFSSKSFLPRSAMLNLTLDLFGQSINFFEVGGRIEGFEAYIERFFGPRGYYPEETIETILRNMRQNNDADATTLEGFLDQMTDEPEGSYYLRVFGNELHYHHFFGLENLIETSGASNPLEFLMDLARQGDVDYTKSYQLIDTHHTIPTVTGLPVTLTAKGTATLGLKMNGNFKARSLKNINIEGHLHPSAAVQIDGVMLVDAHVSRTGLKMSSNLHTSTFLDGKLQINGGKLVDVAFNTPKDKMEVINVKTEFFYLEDDQEVRKDVANLIQEESCTSGVTGIALCGEYSYALSSEYGPSFPFTGPFATSVHFKKTNTQTGYILRYTHEDDQFVFLFDTPGSQTDRKVLLTITKAAKEIEFDLHTPFKSVQGRGEYLWQKNNKNTKLSLVVDGNQQYALETGLRTSGKTVKTIVPSFILTSPAGQVLNIQGNFQANTEAAKYVADVTVSELTASPITVHASFEGESNSVAMDVDLKTPIIDTLIKSEFAYGENFLSSKVDAEYRIMKEAKQTVHHSALLKKELTEDLSKYTIVFDVSPSQYPGMALEYNQNIVLSKGRMENNAKLVHGLATWNANEVVSYANNNGHRELNIHSTLICPQHQIDISGSYALEFSPNHLKSEYHLRLSPGREQSVLVEVSHQYDVETLGRINVQSENLKSSLEFVFNKIAARHYKAQVTGGFNEKEMALEGNFKDNSVAGKINTIVDGFFKTSDFDWKSNLGIYADKDKANVNFKINTDGNEYMAKFEGTRTSLLIESNFVKHILVNAQVTSTQDMKKLHVAAEWDKDVDPTKAFVIDGQFTNGEVGAAFRYGEREVSIVGKLIDSGVEVETKWAADKRIFVNVHYSLGNTKSLAATVQTPFQGWEKQDATFSFSIKDHEVESRFSATWRNTQQMALTVTGKVEPGLFTNALSTTVGFTSTFDKYEHIEFSLDHNMVDSTIKTHLEGAWNQEKMEGNFQLTPNANGVDARATFTSPVTENILVTLHHELLNKQLSTTFEVKYGQEISTATATGHVDLGDVHDIALAFKVDTPVSLIPEINANLKYSLSGQSLNLITEGKIGEKKIMLNVAGQRTVSGDTTDISGDVRFITPFTYPLTASLKHTHDTEHFTSQFEMTRIWSTYGSVKVHAQGNMVSQNDVEFKVDVSSPVNKGSIAFKHIVTNTKMDSSVDVIFNSERIHVSVGGLLDVSRSLANIEAEVTSTFNGLDDIKVRIDSKKEGNTRTSNIVLMKGTKSVVIDHTIAFNDWFNWENSFIVNGIYKLDNKQMHVGSLYKHQLEYMWDRQIVQFEGTFDKKISGNTRQIDAQVSLSTPWTEDMKLDLHHQDDGVEYKPTLIFEYRPGMKIEFASVLKCDSSFLYTASTLTTPFWQPLGYKLNIDFQPRKTVTLVLTRGANRTTIDITGNFEQGKVDGELHIDSTYLTKPVSLEVFYDIISAEKKVNLVLNFDKRYEMTGTIAGHLKHAKWSLMTELPLEAVQKLGFSGEYNVEAMPFTANTVLVFNTQKYQVNGKINVDEFQINVDFNGKTGSLVSSWNYQESYADVEIDFQSPFTTLDNMSVSGMYDFRSEKKVTLKMSRNSEEINLSGRLEGQTIVFEGTTPFSGWETLKASFFISSSAVKAFVSRNDRKIEVTGTLHIRNVKGKINLTINTPYVGYESISVDTSYSLQGQVKTVEFEAKFGSQELSLKGDIKTNDILAPEMTLNIITPFEAVRTLGGEAHWDLRNLVKTAEVKAFRNDRHYHWQLETAADSPLKGYANSKITTPIAGWTTVSLEGNFDFTSMPYRTLFTYNKEGVISTFEVQVSVAENAVSGEITTPISGWEKIALNGDYSLANNLLTGNVEITKSSDKYHLNGDIVFNTQKPKLNIGIRTPLANAANIELDLDANLVDTEKNFHITFKRNDITYSADFTGQMIYKAGFVKLHATSPIPGFTSLDVDAKYDFTGDVKTAEANLMKEGNNQHISLTSTVNDNNFHVEVETPFAGFESVKMDGDYTYLNNKHSVSASFEKNSQKYDFHAEISLSTNSVTLTLATPIADIKHVVINGNYQAIENGMECSLAVERNQDKFEFDAHGYFTPKKSDLHLSLEMPVEGWRKLELDTHYDVISDKKSAEISFQRDSLRKKLYVEGSYNLKSGSFKVMTPIEDFSVLGAEYTLNLDEYNKKLDASVKISQNSNEWTFEAHGQYSDDRIAIKFQTPFEGFDIIAVEGNLNYGNRSGRGVIQFGSYKFTTSISYANDNMSFELTTPFDTIKTLSLSAQYSWTTSQKSATLNITYNDKNFVLSSSLRLSTRASDITFQAKTPFSGFQNTFIEIKCDIDNREELLAFRANADDHRYSFVVGGFIEDKLAMFKLNLNSPFSGWTDAKFVAKIDLSNENKNLEISLEKEGDLKAIAVSGKFIGSTLDFNLRTPFRGLNNFNVFGSLNRSKRSLEMRMMNDAGYASLDGNFNSLRFNMKTPFERAEQISWEITKTGEGSYKAEWRRNDNYATLTTEKDGKKNSFQVNVKSEFRGWEILALTGRLDEGTKQAYLSGAINEQKITISGSGSFGNKSNYNMKIETPYDNYRVVDIQLDYLKRRNTMKIEASSSSSDFHLLWSRSGSGIEAHLIVPNSQQNTEISINLTLTQGKITITSRFEPIRDYLQEYHVNLGETVVTADHIIKLNGREVFKMEFERNAPEQKGHLEIHIHVADRHTTIHFHREGFSKLNFLFKREVPQYGEKHFKVDITGSGALPEKGALDIVVENTFREPASTINARVEVDRSGARKKIMLEVTPRQSRLYVFNLEYDADLQSPRHGDFTLSITTPARRAAPWQNMSGNWNVENPNDATITFTMGNITYNARGKLTLRESTMILSSTNPSAENIFLQWKFERNGSNRDYFLKLGRESKYGMLKLKGTIIDIAHVDIEGGFKAGPFMPDEFLFTSKWDKSNGVVTGDGTFDYGNYHGSHRLVKFERNAERKSASFEWSATSNISGYNSVSVSGNYDFDHKVVIFVLINADGRESKIDVNIADINPTRSRNTAMISIPLLGSTFERTELTVSHDFSHPNQKSISAVAKFGRSESFINAKWNRSDGFETLEGNIEAKSRFLGDILINVRYDMSNIADAYAEVDYSRTTTDGDKKEFKLKWTRKSTDGHLENEMIFDSNFETLSHARAYANAEYGNNFKLLSGLDWNDKEINLTLEVRKNKISGKLTTPFEGFETTEVDLQYKLTGKDKSVNATYQRGDRKASLNVEVSMKGKKGGSFNVDLSTPFEVVKNLHIDGQYENKVAQVNYQRNDIQMNFSGKANIKSSKASFDISFTPPSGQNIRIAASYDVQDFIAGTGTEEKELASLSLEFEGNSLDFSLHGFRNDDRLYVMIHGSSSFAVLKMFHLKLDSELNTEARDGTFELTFNDFKFNVSNHFERRENNGYYFRSRIESTLTPLPALIIGLGREGEERIITIGYGEDKEITFSVKGKNNFLSGFSGKVDIPSLGYEGVEYEVDYSFPGDNHLQIHVEIDLNENGQEVEATFFLDSEGIKARLTSTVLGDHSLRVRRSVSPDGFYAEAGLDDYSLKLRGGFKNEDTARGVQLEGEVFGNRFLIDTLFQSEGKRYSEGKLIIHTPFPGMEKMGGLFTWSNANKKIMARAELHLPSYITPTITGEISLDLKKKINGYVTLDVAGEEFTLKCNLAGSSISQGYTGSLEFYTPFHAVSHVVLTGNIKMQALSFLDMEVKIDAPFATHDLKLKYQLTADKVTGEAFLESTRLYNTIQLSLNIENLSTGNVEVDLTVNDNKINAHYTLAQSTFKFDVTTIIFNKERQFSIEAKYPSLESLEGVVAVTLEGEKHMVSGSLNIINNRIQGALDLESDLIEGPRKLVLDVSKPSDSYKQASFKIIFTSSDPHSFYLDLDLRSGLAATVKIDTPVFPKVTTTLQVAPAIAGITIETPKGTHKVQLSWRQTRRMPSDWIASLELISPLLPENYLFSVNLGSKHIMAELQTGSIKHTLEARTSVSNYGGDLSLMIDTPFENINKVTLDASLNFQNNVEMFITAKFANTVNSFRFNLDKENRKLISIVESPYIPTGMAEAEAMLTGNTNENMQMKMALKNAEDTISGILNIKIKSSQNINTNLKIITPFKGYKKMNFGARYLKDEVTNISVFADKPLKFKADLQFGNTEDVVTTNLVVETPIEDFERIEAEMKVPLYKFAPKVMLTLPHNRYGLTADYGSDSFSQKLSAGVTLNEESYDGYYSLRTKAPYELAYGYNLAQLASTRFHLRTDSSFFSVFA
ncbi:uncharacterized protein LOC134766188 isoform X1 [Penaeus indicus]|uniref:uncharacterized protein LOC134766188 isoform X1 n=1 Tax=Penaeus indicus TaxID=29960 RepID=UPI00300D44DA